VFRDDVHRRHEQGGWSQARYQRGIDREVLDHLSRAAGAVYQEFEERPFDRLIVGCSDELWPETRDALHSYLRERLRGRIELDVERSTPDEVRRGIAPLVAANERSREREAVERLAAGLGQGGNGAAGLDEVVTAHNEHQVALLMLGRDARLSGETATASATAITPSAAPMTPKAAAWSTRRRHRSLAVQA
jgi:peptide chain release factor subunit 1